MIKLEGWACFNKGERLDSLNEISFEDTKALARKRWKGQDIRKCVVTIKDALVEDHENNSSPQKTPYKGSSLKATLSGNQSGNGDSLVENHEGEKNG